MVSKKYNQVKTFDRSICQFLQTLSFSPPKFRDRTKDKEFLFSILFQAGPIYFARADNPWISLHAWKGAASIVLGFFVFLLARGGTVNTLLRSVNNRIVQAVFAMHLFRANLSRERRHAAEFEGGTQLIFLFFLFVSPRTNRKS